MKIVGRLILAAGCAAAVCGCTTQEVSRHVYEGVKSSNEARKPVTPENTAPRLPAYDDYERERRALSVPRGQ